MTPPRSDALVLFGATGDLADKKIFPALYELAKGGALGRPGRWRRRAELELGAVARPREG